MRDNVFKRSFLERIEPAADGCWVWTGTRVRNRSGTEYGRLKRAGKNHLAHRYAFERAFGPLAPGLIVRHECDNSLCVNPDHLVAGTHADNARDREARGRGRQPGGAAHYKSTLSEDDVETIRRLRGTETVRALAARYGVAHNTVVQIQQGDRWKPGPPQQNGPDSR